MKKIFFLTLALAGFTSHSAYSAEFNAHQEAPKKNWQDRAASFVKGLGVSGIALAGIYGGYSFVLDEYRDYRQLNNAIEAYNKARVEANKKNSGFLMPDIILEMEQPRNDYPISSFLFKAIKCIGVVSGLGYAEYKLFLPVALRYFKEAYK